MHLRDRKHDQTLDRQRKKQRLEDVTDKATRKPFFRRSNLECDFVVARVLVQNGELGLLVASERVEQYAVQSTTNRHTVGKTPTGVLATLDER